MPQMSGRQLAERIAVLRPELPVLFMSGYSEGVLGPQWIIGEGAALVEKPFTAETPAGTSPRRRSNVRFTSGHHGGGAVVSG